MSEKLWDGITQVTDDSDLQFLNLELMRIDVRIRRAVRSWQLAGQDPLDNFRGLSISDQEATLLSSQAIGSNWGQSVTLEDDEEAAYRRALAEIEEQIQTLGQSPDRHNKTFRLKNLQQTFGLDQFDLDALLVCLAPALDLRYERLYCYLQDDVTRRRPSVNLILNLLCAPGLKRLQFLSHFSPGAPLVAFRLVELSGEPANNAKNLLGQELQIDPTLVGWLLGRYRPLAELSDQIGLLWPAEDDADRLLAASLESQLDLDALHGYTGGDEPMLVFYGPDLSGQEAAARRCASRLERPLLCVNLAGLIEGGLAPLAALRTALRDALLTGSVPFLQGWDACLAAGEEHFPDLLAELYDFHRVAILAGRSAWQAAGAERKTPLFWVEFPVPAYQPRVDLWTHYLGESTLAGVDVPILAGQFALSGGQIRDAIATARDRAAQRGATPTMQDFLSAARAHSNPHLGALARKITPRYTWEDIVLPDDQLSQLHEIVATVRGRAMVLTEWGVGHKLVASSGVPILFTGEPGTGKTMAAEVIAAELGLDLYKIDLSTVVSKYIGETEKNLERIFGEAESSNAILFFDEADAIFGKRSEVKDAHDRYANIEISYLLQRMEAYDGVTILATNLRANLDVAFTRRLQFAVDFPFPDENNRLRIWQTLFPAEVPRAPDLDFELLARRFKLAGGSIRNILVSAAYLAASDAGNCHHGYVTMAHLLHGARRELQKMGRLVNEADLVVK